MATRDRAETIGALALGWLAAEGELLGTFMGATGTSLDDMRRAPGDPNLLAAVLDFVLMDDAWVLAFARTAGLDPVEVAPARAALPGGAAPHWT